MEKKFSFDLFKISKVKNKTKVFSLKDMMSILNINNNNDELFLGTAFLDENECIKFKVKCLNENIKTNLSVL